MKNSCATLKIVEPVHFNNKIVTVYKALCLIHEGAFVNQGNWTCRLKAIFLTDCANPLCFYFKAETLNILMSYRGHASIMISIRHCDGRHHSWGTVNLFLNSAGYHSDPHRSESHFRHFVDCSTMTDIRRYCSNFPVFSSNSIFSNKILHGDQFAVGIQNVLDLKNSFKQRTPCQRFSIKCDNKIYRLK